jgi:hypothetical protein
VRRRIRSMLADTQRLAVRINEPLRALEFTLYEYGRRGTRYEKAYAVPYEHLSQPTFHIERLLEFLQSRMPSAFASHEAFLIAKERDISQHFAVRHL